MKKQTSFALVLTTAWVLSACGGGGADTATPNPPGTSVSPVTAAANSNSTALSASAIATDSGTEAFDVLASIGDTWRLVVDKGTGAYTLTPNQSLYGLAAESGRLARTVSGDFVSYALDGKISLTQDTRTGALVGRMTVGGQSAQVAGTPYQVADASKLAGTYNFMGSTHDQVGGGNREFYAGQLMVASNGASATFCLGGLVNASGNCTEVDTADGKTPEKAVVSLARDGSGNAGFYRMTVLGSDNRRHDFGNLLVQNGNLGTVLLIDRFGRGDNGASSTVRVGSFYGVKSQTLVGDELDGAWACQTTNGTATLSVNGTRNAVANPAETPGSWTETLSYNRAAASNGALLGFPGFVVSTLDASGVLALPLSASLFVVERDSAQDVALCARK